jgi:hypothetical protein
MQNDDPRFFYRYYCIRPRENSPSGLFLSSWREVEAKKEIYTMQFNKMTKVPSFTRWEDTTKYTLLGLKIFKLAENYAKRTGKLARNG